VGVRADEVLDILDARHTAQVRCWVAGGWGVDALVHAVTRGHRDLDLAVATESFDAAVDVLTGLGFRPEADWLPVRLEVGGGPGGWVDLHPLAVDENGDGVQSGFDGQEFHYPAGDLVMGEIAGRAVPCISASLQRRFHSGYVPRPQDLHDLRLLDALAS
jgi:lincosamide nucleotidyltransferase A/C/D/E